MRKLTALLAGCMALSCGIAPVFAQQAPSVVLQEGEPTASVVPPQQADERRVWWVDFANGLYGRAFLFNTDTGKLLGTLDMGWEGIKPDLPRNGSVFYNHGMYMARGFRGPRLDVVEIFDKSSLNKLGEIEVPPKMIRGWPNLNHSSMSDDERFLFLQFFTPASSIGIVDLEGKKFAGEVEMAGCAHIMAAGPRRFFSLCGDGSVQSVAFNDSGAEVARERLSNVFDADLDPLHGTGVRNGNLWYFVTQKGRVKVIDVSGPKLKLKKGWNAGEITGDNAWIPADIMQNLSFHQASNSLYVLMHNGSLKPKGGGADYHRQPGTEVWVWDVATGKRTLRIPLSAPSSAIAISPGPSPMLYAGSIASTKLLVIDAASGKEVRQLEGGAMPTLIIPVAP